MRFSLEARLTRCNSFRSSSNSCLNGSDAKRDITRLLPCFFVQHRTFPLELTSDPLGAYRLKKEPRKAFLKRFEERLNEEITHPTFGNKVKYRRCIELQPRLVAKYLTGQIDE